MNKDVRTCSYFSKPKGVENKNVLETPVYPVPINKHSKVQPPPDDGVSVVDEKLRAGGLYGHDFVWLVVVVKSHFDL